MSEPRRWWLWTGLAGLASGVSGITLGVIALVHSSTANELAANSNSLAARAFELQLGDELATDATNITFTAVPQDEPNSYILNVVNRTHHPIAEAKVFGFMRNPSNHDVQFNMGIVPSCAEFSSPVTVAGELDTSSINQFGPGFIFSWRDELGSYWELYAGGDTRYRATAARKMENPDIKDLLPPEFTAASGGLC